MVSAQWPAHGSWAYLPTLYSSTTTGKLLYLTSLSFLSVKWKQLKQLLHKNDVKNKSDHVYKTFSIVPAHVNTIIFFSFS